MANERLLIVDDDADLLGITSEACRMLGHPPLTAPDAATALRLLEASPGLRLAIVDVELEVRWGGFRLGERVAERFPDVAVVFVSGYGSHAGRPPGEEATEVLKKPVSLGRLKALLDGHLGPAGGSGA